MKVDNSHDFNWAWLVPRVIHPLRVAIIEALAYMDQPLSATDLQRLFGIEDLQLSLISYHVNQLKNAEVLVKVGQRQVRGAVERFYVLKQQ
jgi:hypothetical protein